MSLLDIVEAVGEGTNKTLIPNMTGSFNVTIGDAVAGIFGARHTHIYGGEIKLVCDPEDFLLGQVAHKIPTISALLGGIGGQATFVYAQNTSATYGGPKVDIRRAPSISKQTDYIIPRAGKPATVSDPPDPVDGVMCAAVTVLSVLVIAVPAVMELMIRFKYPQYGSAAASQETLEGYGETPGILKLCAYAVTSRLMELLKQLEELATFADCARYAATVAAAYGEKAIVFMMVNIGRLSTAVDGLTKSMGESLEAVGKFLADTKDILSGNAFDMSNVSF